jgi:hypothetical protein
MTIDNIIQILTPLLPALLIVFGGQWILNRYETRRKAKEKEAELISSIREQQYEAVESLYRLFAKFMELYRIVNNPNTDLSAPDTQRSLLAQAIEAEAGIDALILRIGCEFVQGPRAELEPLLGNLRQSVQLWRELIRAGKRLPFTYSEQEDYVRFKEAFAGTAAFMVHQIHNRLEPPAMRMEESQSLLLGAFSNKYERRDYSGKRRRGRSPERY